jgi:hypothetical protein
MALFLAESILPKDLRDKSQLEAKVDTLVEQAEKQGLSFIETQVSGDLARAFFVVEANDQSSARDLLSSNGIPVTLVKQVRLVGQELDEVRKNAGQVRYVVEWNLPENLTMEAYLNRKKTNSVHYAEVPEVSFKRTYVCEDMTKCLCLYDAPDEAAVLRAREAVKAPVDAITETAPVAQRVTD